MHVGAVNDLALLLKGFKATGDSTSGIKYLFYYKMNANSTGSLNVYMADTICARALAGETACLWLVAQYYLHLSRSWHATQVATKRTAYGETVVT